jgi:hypothetical protein
MNRARQSTGNTDFQSVRLAELYSADLEDSGQYARWSHRQDACVPIS